MSLSFQRRIFQARLGPPFHVRPRAVVEDALTKLRRRGREGVPVFKPFARLGVAWLRRLSGAHEAGRRVEEGPTEVYVVGEHQGLRAMAFVAHDILDPHTRLPDAGGDRAPQNQVGAEHSALAHLCARFKEAALPVPPGLVREEGGWGVGDSAVQSELLSVSLDADRCSLLRFPCKHEENNRADERT